MLLQHVSTHGGHLQAELRYLFYISILTVLFYHFAIGIPHALQLDAGSRLQSGKTTL